ncbi:MAG: AAA family ATPase, partial [Candidatus Lokiarchaeota archaeon]|nr:AAA family ATPase [Candidatus Lokiarchaeota archaeon]
NKLDGLKEDVSKLRERIGILEDEQIPQAEELYEESKKAAENIEEIGEKQRKAAKALKVVNRIRQFYREVQKPLRRRDTSRASRHATEIFKTLIGSNEYDQIRIADNHDLLISRFGSFEPMRTLSGGEQVLAGLAVRLGFARALATSDLLMLDEPTAYLDDQRKAELVETLDNVTPANQLLIVTHDDEFQRVAQRVIHVDKDESMLVSSISHEG